MKTALRESLDKWKRWSQEKGHLEQMVLLTFREEMKVEVGWVLTSLDDYCQRTTVIMNTTLLPIDTLAV